MQYKVFYCEDEIIKKLLSEFKLQQGSLFHYTGKSASIGINKGEVWLTRADCFLDSSEIEHGLKVLSEASQTVLNECEIESFSGILKALRTRLESCFVMSLSQDPNNEYLKFRYAGDDGAILEFKEGFPQKLHQGWHFTPLGDGSGKLDFLVDIYDFFEGFVIYGDSDQQNIAKMACQFYQKGLNDSAHIVDIHHFIDILIRCLVLFKTKEFEGEAEYRVAFVLKPTSDKSFEKTRNHNGSEYIYFKSRIPNTQNVIRHTRSLKSIVDMTLTTIRNFIKS